MQSMQDNFMSAHAHATAQHAFDIPAVLEKNKILRFQCNYKQFIQQYCNNINVLFSLSSTYFNLISLLDLDTPDRQVKVTLKNVLPIMHPSNWKLLVMLKFMEIEQSPENLPYQKQILENGESRKLP